MTRTCAKCARSEPEIDFYQSDPSYCKECRRAVNNASAALNREAGAARSRKHYQKLRDETFARYGTKCACCGETEPKFLSIDHVNNDGAEHRRSLGAKNRGGVHTYRWLRQNGWPDGYQTLCHNCNLGRHLNGGVCPHANRVS